MLTQSSEYASEQNVRRLLFETWNVGSEGVHEDNNGYYSALVQCHYIHQSGQPLAYDHRHGYEYDNEGLYVDPNAAMHSI